MKTYCAFLTSVSHLVKKLQIAIVDIISISHVIRARLHTTCNNPTETLQLNEHPVTRQLYNDADAACDTWTSYRQYSVSL